MRMRYSTVIESPSTYACIIPLINSLIAQMKHTTDTRLTVSVAKGIIVITSSVYVTEVYQTMVCNAFDSLVGKNNYNIKFNQYKPDYDYAYHAYI